MTYEVIKLHKHRMTRHEDGCLNPNCLNDVCKVFLLENHSLSIKIQRGSVVVWIIYLFMV